jgi:non-ribosomal peptide synthase protein (TIGR01720 family)
MRVAYFDCGRERPAQLLWVIHHLAVDGVSWRILLDELWTAYQQLRRGEPIRLPPVPAQFQDWATRLVAYARSDALQLERDLWLAKTRVPSLRLPLDMRGGANTRASVGLVCCALSAAETRSLLREIPGICRSQIREVLLAALARALAPWVGPGTLVVDLEGQGREHIFDDVDLSRTVGWFTTITPFVLELDAAEEWPGVLQQVKDQLRRIPNNGLGYGVLRYLGADAAFAAELRASPQAEVCFNYLGQFDAVLPDSAPFRPSRQSSGPFASPIGVRRHLIEIDGQVEAGQLQFRWQYSTHRHRLETIERLAQGFVNALRDLIAHCRSPAAGNVVPSDFPLAGLNQDQLGKVAKLLKSGRAQ